jgi:DNA-binding transcriptional ArsR family regulator
MDITEKVLEIMRNEGQPLNAGKITEIGGLERKAVDKAMAKLKKEEKIVSPKRCYWEPA